MSNVHLIDHPLVQHKLSLMRNKEASTNSFRRLLHLDEHRLPLACVLEGGSWAAGRELAQRHRNGLPPLQVASDGTVF